MVQMTKTHTLILGVVGSAAVVTLPQAPADNKKPLRSPRRPEEAAPPKKRFFFAAKKRN